ncbi:peptide ABC transporter substrate-binding protein [Candidatus Dojkabacteria bacterium]|nr:peptide ABC transporter substrate-binding protein [Candidatus Dojkabacteria bacterium]
MFKALEKGLYKIRDFFWSYPDLLFSGRDSFFGVFIRVYKRGRPISHVLATTSVILLLAAVTLNNVSAFLYVNSDDYIEGVITGIDENGDLASVNKLNPLIPQIVQLERDLNEIIYESLVEVKPDGSVEPVLLDRYEEIETGEKYNLYLKKNIFWHDGKNFNAGDVIETHRLLKELNSRTSTQSSFSKAAVKMVVKKIDDYAIEVTVNGILPNFFEVMRYKILPAHLISEITADNINTSKVKINTNPVGTGPYKFRYVRAGRITVSRFDSYHGKEAKLNTITFVPFQDERSALNAIKSGEIHGLMGASVDSMTTVSDYPNIKQIKSSTLYNQYWGLHFNLREEGPEALKDKKVRQAIAYAIDRARIIEILNNQGEIANGPIPPSSFAYNPDLNVYNFDKESAEKLLSESGWEGETKTKNGQEMKFVLTYVDNVDRNKIAEQIKLDLSMVGINIELNPKSLIELNQDYILPRRFEILLYGVNTFIDPDRFEFFSSGEKEHPGLNISGYASEKKTKKVISGEMKEIPAVDSLLDAGRSYGDIEKRKERYHDFQDIVTLELPTIYLYHPTFTYLVNKRVEGVDLSNISSLEDRFLSISNWQIVL